MEFYQNVAEFCGDIIKLSKEILECYISRTVLADDKNLAEIKGRIVWARDLKNLASGSFSDTEIEEYDSIQEDIRKHIKLIKEKCSLSAQKKVIIPLVYLINRFQCSEFETMMIFLVAAAEMDVSFSKTYQILMNDLNALTPSLEMCLMLYSLDEKIQQEIIVEENIRRKLLDFFFEKADTERRRDVYTNLSRPLRMNRRVLDFTLNRNSENEYIGKYISLIWPWSAKNEEPLVHRDVCGKMIRYAAEIGGKKLFCLTGSDGCGKHFMLRQFARYGKVNIILVNAGNIPDSDEDSREIFRNIKTECMVRNAVIAFENVNIEKDFLEGAGQEHFYEKRFLALCKEFWEISDIIFLLASKNVKFTESELNDKTIIIDLNSISQDDSIMLWKNELGSCEYFQNVKAEHMAMKFDFSPGKITRSVLGAVKMMRWEGRDSIDEKMLTEACYKQVSHRLSERAVRINAKYTWEDLILPENQKSMLKEACNQVRFRHTVYDVWGFGSKNHYGTGVSMLFYGPPGTGKTMTAQVIANELGMEIYKVDLSTIMSKYIGETEKNLSVIFDEVKKSNSILFFDEADAMFGKRTETKESNDKYANAETAYLLQKMEEYSGIVILASNLVQNFDEAYKRRIKFMIHFPFPDVQQRILLWKSCFTKDAPMGYIDYEFLGNQFELSGSNIKNIAINAAFMAASQNAAISMEYIIIALKRETEKYGKLLNKEELGEYYYLV